MPTVKDRIQVLLEPEDFAAVTVMSKEEQRSLASMGAVLIREAIKARRDAGTYLPEPSAKDEALRIAKLRRQAKVLGKGTNELVEREEKKQDKAQELLDVLSKLLTDHH
jgi:hypothetical protein